MKSLHCFALALVAIASLASGTQAAVIYRETFGRQNNNLIPGPGTGDASSNDLGWGDFTGATGVFNTVNANSGINGSNTGRLSDVANVNSGPNYDGTTGAYAIGIHFFLAAAGTPVLTMTDEYVVDPTSYTNLAFSWYQGNANTTDTMRLAIRQGGQWYVGASTFTSAAMGIAAFGANAELKTVAYDPAAANWLALSFDGDFDSSTKIGTSGTVLTVGAVPGGPLSGTIDAFGLLVSGTGTRRFDTFEINGNPIPEPASCALAFAAVVGLAAIRRRA